MTVKLLTDKSKLENYCSKIFSQIYPANQDILIKIHFGEPGNKTALTPAYILPIITSLKKQGLHPTLIDTPVAYDSVRNTVAGYQKFVNDIGWTKIAPCLISDNFVEVETKNLKVKVCKELIEAQNLLVISHVKGHSCAGFGGAIKNFGMGGLMPESKNAIHDGSKPNINYFTCTGCGTCARYCPAKAIKFEHDKTTIDLNECWGCSICQLACSTKSLTPKVALFDDLLAQGAAACINNLPKNIHYINFIQNISKSCDCESDPGELIAPDVGILFSDNPVAIDQAGIDLVGKEIFKKANRKDPTLQIQYASEYTGLSAEYQLEKL